MQRWARMLVANRRPVPPQAVRLLDQSGQPGKMHATRIMHPTRDHPRAVRRDDPAQLRYRHVRPVLGYQAIGAKPAATVAAVA